MQDRVAGALKRVREQEVASFRVDPDAKVVAARDKVARLEQAIAAMGDFKGAKMDTLLKVLKRARKRTFHDEERATEVSRLEESEKRLS